MIAQIKDKITQIFKKDFIVGLDIGASSIKFAQFTKKEDGLHLVKTDLKDIKEEKEIVSVLKDLFKGIDVKKSKIIASINCPQTAIKIAKAPYMPKAELREGINLEAKNYFPFPIDDSLLDYEILGDVVEKGIRKYEVAVSVSPKPTVEKYLSLLEKVGIKPASFVSSSYALQKVAQNLSTEEEKTLVFVDIGKLHTELIICKGKHLLFSRKIPVAGDEFTRAMTGVLVSDRGRTELTIDEAEKIKQETGIPSEAELKIIADKISTAQISSMLRAPLEQLVSEIERCFDYYREESGGGKIDSLLLFGGGAFLKGLTKFLSEELGIEVGLGDSLEKLKIEENAVSERGKVSYRLGLAIGGALTESKGINLLPPEIKEETKRLVEKAVPKAIFTAAVTILVLIFVGMRIQLASLDKKITTSKFELSAFQRQFGSIENQLLISGIIQDQPYWEDALKEISNVIPQNIYLKEMNMQRQLLVIKGTILASGNPEETLSHFIQPLERGIFKNVRFTTVGENEGLKEFQLQMELE